jgi:hypothetical protein
MDLPADDLTRSKRVVELSIIKVQRRTQTIYKHMKLQFQKGPCKLNRQPVQQDDDMDSLGCFMISHRLPHITISL